MISKILKRISENGYVRKAIDDKADLSAFKGRPSPRIIMGISAIIFSYIIGLPMVGLFGVLSVYAKKPEILIIGGPVIYGFSHLVFIFGMYLAGYQYTKIFLRWATRVGVEKLLKYKVNS